MSERHEPGAGRGEASGTTAGGAPDPLARIGARLIEAERGRRRRRRHARQRIAGGMLTLLALAAVLVAARPFDGGGPTALTNRGVELNAGDGRFTVYATGDRSICAMRPNGRDRAGTTECAPSGLVIELLERQGGLAWVQARAVGDRVVVTGLAAPDASVLVSMPPRDGRLGASARARPEGPTVTVGKLGAPPLVARPFSLSLPRARAKTVLVAASGPDATAETRSVRIGAAMTDRLDGFERLDYEAASAAGIAELAQARLREMTPLPGHQRAPAGVLVLGDGNRLTAWVRPARVAAARLALKPGVLRIYDWEASALLPDGSTVADGTASGSPRAMTISRTAAASAAMTLADARRLAGRQHGRARIVQAIGAYERDLPLPRDDPRARFYVVRGGPALTGAEGVVVAPVDATRIARPGLLFRDAQRAELRRVTRAVAQRGQSLMLPGTSAEAAAQHLAIVLDDRLIEVAPIDPAALPDGVTGRTVTLPDRFARRWIRDVEDKLRLGPLPPLTEIR